MKKLTAALPLLTFLSLAPYSFAEATEQATIGASGCDSGSFSALCALASGDTGKVMGLIVQFFFFIAIIAALIFLVYGGFRWLISGGDEKAIEGARNQIIAAIIGLVIVFLTYFILNLILNLFNLGSLSGIKVPQLN